mmetsp:Transcript_9667/g.32191  ORF Transcript_9667/g.32191 Transcript_9667/m.32191 type:complete len:269 (+) Transcript_9667:2-808(+)
MMAARPPPPLSHLHFLHIPKTGGTSIEMLGLRLGVRWGANDQRQRVQVRDGEEGSFKCVPPWHSPRRFPGPTFCVVREPASRWVAQWHHEETEPSKYCDKGRFDSWTKRSLSALRASGGNRSTRANCHFLPTAEYAAHCSTTLRYEQLASDLRALLECYDLGKSNATALSAVAALEHAAGGPHQQQKRGDTGEEPPVGGRGAGRSVQQCAAAFAQQVRDDPRFRSLYAADMRLWRERSSTGAAVPSCGARAGAHRFRGGGRPSLHTTS